MEEVDKNKDGYIDMDEFINALDTITKNNSKWLIWS